MEDDQLFRMKLLEILDYELCCARQGRDNCQRRLIAAAGDEQRHGELCQLANELVAADRTVKFRAALVNLASATMLEHSAFECVRRMPSLVDEAHRMVI